MPPDINPPESVAPETAVEPAPVSTRPALDIEDLREFLDNLGSFAGPELILESSSVSRLYHYTDLAGLNGILSTNDLWLTHLQFLNDDEEMTHGQNIVAQVLKTRKVQADPAQATYLKIIEKILNEPLAGGVYICCFCEKDN
jgi:hypothetical protein